MNDFLDVLGQHIEIVEEICNKIGNREFYMGELREYIPFLNKIIPEVLVIVQNPEYHLEISQEFILQILTDILYGIENEDSVFLLDVLQYGLLTVYNYIGMEIKAGNFYE